MRKYLTVSTQATFDVDKKNWPFQKSTKISISPQILLSHDVIVLRQQLGKTLVYFGIRIWPRKIWGLVPLHQVSTIIEFYMLSIVWWQLEIAVSFTAECFLRASLLSYRSPNTVLGYKKGLKIWLKMIQKLYILINEYCALIFVLEVLLIKVKLVEVA